MPPFPTAPEPVSYQTGETTELFPVAVALCAMHRALVLTRSSRLVERPTGTLHRPSLGKESSYFIKLVSCLRLDLEGVEFGGGAADELCAAAAFQRGNDPLVDVVRFE